MLLSTPVGNSAAAASTASTQPSASSAADSGSAAQFKSQFDQAVTALTGAAAPAAPASTASAAAAQGTSAASAAQTATIADTLTATLQKKIADLLAKGESVAEIVQQLAASLASTLAAQFGGNPAQIQNQLQTAFASALSPPTTGPPQSAADLASALAQRFRQVADVAAGVIGETGQSNRLFAGSISDAATTAGVQPAPQPDPSGSSLTTADSTAPNASALIATLTATPGDGKTVALNDAPALGSNGDNLLGRILARAAQSSLTAPAAPQTQAAAAPVQAGPATGLAALALAAATAALGKAAPQSTTPTVATGTPVALATRVSADAGPQTVENSGSTTADAPIAAAAPSPAVAAFVRLFTDAIASASASASDLKATDPNGNPTGTLLQTTVTSSQAPTIGAFAPVQSTLATDATVTNGAQTPTPLPSQTTVDPNTVVEQILRGAFLNTVGSTSTVRLRLVPEELGDLSVKLTVNGSSVDAQVMAQTPAAHDALVAGQGQLSRALADAGLKLNSFNVDLAGGFSSFQQQQQQSSQQSTSNGRSLLLGGVDTPENDESALTAAPNFGPPVLAGANWSALNYLV
jgi:flagellar hook-length control protein FliK